jgi:hypothetical protein
MLNVKERYENDCIFRTMVDSLVVAMEQGTITPTEAREAAMFAQILYEDRNPRPVFFTREDLHKMYSQQGAPWKL